MYSVTRHWLPSSVMITTEANLKPIHVIGKLLFLLSCDFWRFYINKIIALTDLRRWLTSAVWQQVMALVSINKRKQHGKVTRLFACTDKLIEINNFQIPNKCLWVKPNSCKHYSGLWSESHLAFPLASQLYLPWKRSVIRRKGPTFQPMALHYRSDVLLLVTRWSCNWPITGSFWNHVCIRLLISRFVKMSTVG